MHAIDFVILFLILLVIAAAVRNIVRSRKKGGMCSCCDQAGTCIKNREAGKKR